MLHVLEIEVAIGLGAFLLAYGCFSLVLWGLSRSSERRIRGRMAKAAAASASNDDSRATRS